MFLPSIFLLFEPRYLHLLFYACPTIACWEQMVCVVGFEYPQMARLCGLAAMLNEFHLVASFLPGADLDSGFELMTFR